MPRISKYQKTLDILKESGFEGITLGDILESGVNRASFYRHREKIEKEGHGVVEGFHAQDGETRYRLVSGTSNSSIDAIGVNQSNLVMGFGTTRIHGEHSKSVRSWQESIWEVIDYPKYDIIESPSISKEYLNDPIWTELIESINLKQAVRIDDYECLEWEAFDQSPVIFPQAVITFGEHYYIRGFWQRDNRFTEVYLTLAGVLKYTVITTMVAPKDFGLVLPRWRALVFGIDRLHNKISREVWHRLQLDVYPSSDDGQRWKFLHENSHELSVGAQSGRALTKDVIKRIEESEYKFIRIIPWASELTWQKMMMYFTVAEKLHLERTD